MLYEIINPSDAYTFEAKEFAVAAVSMVLLGEGRLAAKPVGEGSEGAPEVPLLLFGGAEEWFEKNLFPLEKMGDFLDENAEKVASALDSVVIGEILDRSLFLSAMERIVPELQEAFKIEWHDRKRSSLNDIGREAWEMAKGIRENLEGKC